MDGWYHHDQQQQQYQDDEIMTGENFRIRDRKNGQINIKERHAGILNQRARERACKIARERIK